MISQKIRLQKFFQILSLMLFAQSGNAQTEPAPEISIIPDAPVSSFITTASGYDAFSRQPIRKIIDLTVPNAPYEGLSYVRSLNASARQLSDKWTHNHKWQIGGTSNFVNIINSDGNELSFHAPTGTAINAAWEAGHHGGKIFVSAGAPPQRTIHLYTKDGIKISIEYNPEFNCALTTSATYPSGLKIFYAYERPSPNAPTRLKRISTMSGQWIELQYNFANLIKAVISSSGETVTYNWKTATGDALPQNGTVNPYLYAISQVSYMDGTSATYNYIHTIPGTAIQRYQITSLTDARSTQRIRSLKYGWRHSQRDDPYNRLISEAQTTSSFALSNIVATEGLSGKNRRTETTADGRFRFIEYALNDEDYNPTLISDFLGHLTTIAYTSINHRKYHQEITNPLGHTLKFEREPVVGAITKTTYPDGSWTEKTYSNSNAPFFTASNKNEHGHQTIF